MFNRFANRTLRTLQHHFPHPKQRVTFSLSPKMKFATFGVGVLSFSLAASQLAHALNHSNADPNQTQQITLNHNPLTTANPKLVSLLHAVYPQQSATILDIYEAIGLTPLLNHAISNAPAGEEITVLNKILQEILLRPKNVQRAQLNDASYIKLITERLTQAYNHMSIPNAFPPPDVEKLKTLLSQPSTWQHQKAQDNLRKAPYDAVLIMGSTYQDYLNRQNAFLDAIAAKTLHFNLNAQGKIYVYLLGGDRTLNKPMDGAIMETLRTHHQPLTEQSMMNWMFAQATEHLQTPSFHIISSNSPKEEGGRPTTAGTLDSVIPHLSTANRVLVISSEPFIRYQRWVTERQFLNHNLMLEVEATGADIDTTIRTHPELARSSLIAITLDTLAREVYEKMTMGELKKHKKRPSF